MRGMRKFFWLVIFLFVFVVSHAAAIEITQVGKVVAPHPNTNQEFLILISDNFWQVPEVQEAVERYQDDVYQHRQVGSRVFMVSPSEIPKPKNDGFVGGDIYFSERIREFIKSVYYFSNSILVGVILVGDVPWVVLDGYSAEDDRFESLAVGDVYFGELNFEDWRLKMKPECPQCGAVLALPEYCSDLNCLQPEIWISRLRPIVEFNFWKKFSFEERVEMILRFFDKDHHYYQKENNHQDFLHLNFMNGVFGCSFRLCDNPKLFPGESEDRVICVKEGLKEEEFFSYCGSSFRVFHEDSHGGNGFMYNSDRGVSAEKLFESVFASPVIIAESCSSANFSGNYSYSMVEALLFGSNSDALVGIGCGGSCYGIPDIDLRFLPVGEAVLRMEKNSIDIYNKRTMIEGDPFVKVAKEIDLPLTPTFISTSWEEYFYRFSSKYWEARPLVVSRNGDWVELKLGFTGFKEPVDIYVGAYESKTGNFYVWTDKRIIFWNWNVSSLVPYKQQWVNGFENILFSGNVTDLPNGYYDGYVMVVPSGTDMNSFSFESSTYYLWYWRWQR